MRRMGCRGAARPSRHRHAVARSRARERVAAREAQASALQAMLAAQQEQISQMSAANEEVQRQRKEELAAQRRRAAAEAFARWRELGVALEVEELRQQLHATMGLVRRARAATGLQRFVRHRKVRRAWDELARRRAASEAGCYELEGARRPPEGGARARA